MLAARANLALAADTGWEGMQLTAFGHFRGDLDAYLTMAGRAGAPAGAAWGHVLAWKGAVLARQAFLREAARVPELAPRVQELRQASARLAEAALAADPAAAPWPWPWPWPWPATATGSKRISPPRWPAAA